MLRKWKRYCELAKRAGTWRDAATWTGMTLKKFRRHKAVLVRRFNLRAPCIRGKDVADSNSLLVIQTFNIKYDTSIFSWERHCIQVSGYYLGLARSRARGRLKTGEDGLAMSIKFMHYKGADNKLKLAIFFFTPTRRLIFCFISVIVSLAIYENAIELKVWRKGAANAVNGNAPNAVRDQMMRYDPK
ncbi:hypothetical protein MFIFM68171_07692 [Madurella fahalii]|uniref:Uncharacterized protein n=1 Tax=Madurella fahalii TaxID=1157608 RepID=A0ABQ0GI91_9PEZI